MSSRETGWTDEPADAAWNRVFNAGLLLSGAMQVKHYCSSRMTTGRGHIRDLAGNLPGSRDGD
jgi:hypothetical protein